MMPLIWGKEKKPDESWSLLTQKIKLSIHQMLEISRSRIDSIKIMQSEEIFYPQRTFDHLYWNSTYTASSLNTFNGFFFSLTNLIPKILRNKVTDEYLFLKLWIASLYHCLDYSHHLFIYSDLKLNKFRMSKFFFDSAQNFLCSESLDSRQLDQFLKKMPEIIYSGNLSIINSLLSDKIITYQRWGHPMQVTVPINQLCGKVIRKILHHKFRPMVIQYQSTALQAIIRSLPAISPVLIPLIYQYYNEIKFLDIKKIFNTPTAQNQFELFYHAEKTEHTPSKISYFNLY